MAGQEPVQYTLPDLLANWPWPERINPYYEEVKEETSAWIQSLNAFDAKARKAFDKCDFSRYSNQSELPSELEVPH